MFAIKRVGSLNLVRAGYLSSSKRSLTDSQINLIQESWKDVRAIGPEKVGAILFRNIFEAAPGALQMFSFKDEPNLYESKAFLKHGKTVVNTVGAAVAGLKSANHLIPYLEDLGDTHQGFGNGAITKETYDLVGAMLMKTFKTGLGPKFTPELEVAWTEVVCGTNERTGNANGELQTCCKSLSIREWRFSLSGAEFGGCWMWNGWESDCYGPTHAAGIREMLNDPAEIYDEVNFVALMFWTENFGGVCFVDDSEMAAVAQFHSSMRCCVWLMMPVGGTKGLAL
eukprot:gene5111-10229_t